jgi:hypothetical protein
MPQFAAVENIFAQTPPASWYPSYEVPRNVLPPPRHLIRIARNIFPHWKARRERRKGHRIIPQLNFDETNDGDPYVCFRRRDVKVTRKTRQKDLMVLDRMKTIQPEMSMATKIVGMVFERERDKERMIKADRTLWDQRWNLIQFKRKNPHLPITPEEEIMLTPERKIVQVPTALQQQQQQQTNTQAYAAAQARKRMDREREDIAKQAGFGAALQNRIPKSRAQSPVNDRVPPEQLAGLLAKRVEEELRRKKEADRGWEDSADVSFLLLARRTLSSLHELLTPPDIAPRRSDTTRSVFPPPNGIFGTSHLENCPRPALATLVSPGWTERRLRSGKKKANSQSVHSPSGCVEGEVESYVSIVAARTRAAGPIVASEGDSGREQEREQHHRLDRSMTRRVTDDRGSRSRTSSRNFHGVGRRATPYDRTPTRTSTVWMSTARTLRSRMIKNRLRSARERGC